MFRSLEKKDVSYYSQIKGERDSRGGDEGDQTNQSSLVCDAHIEFVLDRSIRSPHNTHGLEMGKSLEISKTHLKR